MSAQIPISATTQCPICGFASEACDSAAALAERQLRLKVQANALSNGEIHFNELRDQAEQMCTCCRLLMMGLSSDADIPELVDRIKVEVQALREEGVPSVVPDPAIVPNLRRDPEDRHVETRPEHEVRDKMMDKTLADSYPCSDAPSSIPNPGEDSVCPLDLDKAA